MALQHKSINLKVLLSMIIIVTGLCLYVWCRFGRGKYRTVCATPINSSIMKINMYCYTKTCNNLSLQLNVLDCHLQFSPDNVIYCNVVRHFSYLWQSLTLY